MVPFAGNLSTLSKIVDQDDQSVVADKQALARPPVLVDFALQGGGSHGAFTWGVLDRLLEEPWLQIDGISGTSAGAMNAAVLADGYAEGGAEGARAALEGFWRSVSDAARFSPFQRGPLDVLLGRWTLDHSPMFVAMDIMARLFSPYDLESGRQQSAARHPGRERSISSGWRKRPIKLFITATNVRTGRGRVFRNAEITPDVLLASACLPTMFQAIEIDGEAYWDGGYSRQSDHHAAGARMQVAATRSWCRSIRSSGRARRARRATSSTGSTRCRSMPCC